MRIAISAMGPTLDAEVDSRFARCQYFIIVAPETMEFEALENSSAMAGEGVSVVIASGMGSQAQNLFRQNRIDVVIGTLDSDPERAILSYLNGSLATGDNICDH